MVERSIAWLVADGNRRVRYRGIERNQHGLSLARPPRSTSDASSTSDSPTNPPAGSSANAGPGADNEGPLYGISHLGYRLHTLKRRFFGPSMNPGPPHQPTKPNRHPTPPSSAGS